MTKGTQGFASPNLDEARKREIHRLGGQTAHRLGKAHAWTSEEAQAAGRKGQALQRQRRAQAAGREKASPFPSSPKSKRKS